MNTTPSIYRVTDTAFWAKAGDGVAPFLTGEIKPAVARRIERIGKMNDRVEAAITAHDRISLLKIAEEYENFGRYGMPHMAERIRLKAQEI
jgi:hypothetical protein